MSTHTHYVKVTLEVGNASDSEAHQEVVLTQRTESAVQNMQIQQTIIKAVNDALVALGNAAAAEKEKSPKKSGVIR